MERRYISPCWACRRVSRSSKSLHAGETQPTPTLSAHVESGAAAASAARAGRLRGGERHLAMKQTPVAAHVIYQADVFDEAASRCTRAGVRRTWSAGSAARLVVRGGDIEVSTKATRLRQVRRGCLRGVLHPRGGSVRGTSATTTPISASSTGRYFSATQAPPAALVSLPSGTRCARVSAPPECFEGRGSSTGERACRGRRSGQGRAGRCVPDALCPESLLSVAVPSIDRKMQTMDMLSGEQITAAALTDWSKLGQGLHARFTSSATSTRVSVSSPPSVRPGRARRATAVQR